MDAKKKKQTAVGLWVLAGILTISSGLKLIVALIAAAKGDTAGYSLDSIAFDTLLLVLAFICQRKANSSWREAKVGAGL